MKAFNDVQYLLLLLELRLPLEVTRGALCSLTNSPCTSYCSQFRPLIEGCYYNDGDAITRFVFELTKSEAERLAEQFEKAPDLGTNSRLQVRYNPPIF